MMVKSQMKTNVMLGCLGAITVFALAPFGILWEAYVAVKCWVWYASPVFGIRAISYPEAIGLGLLFHALKGVKSQVTKFKNQTTGELIEAEPHIATAICTMFVGPAVILLMAWITHFWM